MRYGFKARAERISANARRLVGLSLTSPLPARTLAKAMRVAVIGPREIPGFPEDLAKQLLFDFEKRWSGVIIPLGDASVIVHNTSHVPARQESDIMHELAHILCAHKPAKIEPPGTFPFAMRSYDEEQEEQAEWLGGCLQIPRLGLLEALRHRLDDLAIADHFGASLEMVRFRKNLSGVFFELAQQVGGPAPSLRRKVSLSPKRKEVPTSSSVLLQTELF